MIPGLKPVSDFKKNKKIARSTIQLGRTKEKVLTLDLSRSALSFVRSPMLRNIAMVAYPMLLWRMKLFFCGRSP